MGVFIMEKFKEISSALVLRLGKDLPSQAQSKR